MAKPLKKIKYRKGNGYVAFYKDLNIINDLSKVKNIEFLDEWITTEPNEEITVIHEWQAFIRFTQSFAKLVIVNPGDFFTCEQGDELLWAFVYATPEAIEAFKLKDTTQAFKLYDDTENICVQCTLKGPDPLTSNTI